MKNLRSALFPSAFLVSLFACGGSIASSSEADSGAPPGDRDASDGASSGAKDGAALVDAKVASDAASDPNAPADPNATASGFQIDALHSGVVQDPSLAGPLARLWTLPFGHLGGYPLIVGNKVIVAVPASKGAQLWALDIRSGATIWGPISLTTTTFGGPAEALTYENGQILALNAGGSLEAHDVATGAQTWLVTLADQTTFTAPPTARSGMVFISGSGVGGTVYGVDAANGHVAWTQPVQNGDQSSPTVTANGVFVAYACNQAYRFAPSSGAVMWHHEGTCEGGGGATAVLNDGLLYSIDELQCLTLDEGTGAKVGAFTASAPPVFHAGAGYFLEYGTLTAIDLATQAVRWTFKSASTNPNDGIVTPPLVVGGRVFVGTEYGTVYGIDEATGKVTFTDEIQKPFGFIETFYTALNGLSISSFASAQGVIAVSTTSELIVYAPGADAGTGDSGM